MTKTLRTFAAAAGLALAASAASAVTVTPAAYDNTFDIGDAFGVNLDVAAGEVVNNFALTFTANDDVQVTGTATFNPFSTTGPGHAFTLAVSYNGGAAVPVPVTPFLGIGGAGGTGKMYAGDYITIFLSGTGGAGGTDIDYHFEVQPIPVPAAGFLLLGGLGALVAGRRKKA